MPKKGERQPYRVVYTYPGRTDGRVAVSTYVAAEQKAKEISRHGATVVIFYMPPIGDPVRAAAFGPDVTHAFGYAYPPAPKMGYRCECGNLSHTDDEVRSHMEHAGLCPVCWGTGQVARPVTTNGDDWGPGPLMGCPACQGSGQDADVDYHDVDRSSYYSRLQMLRYGWKGEG